MIIRAAKPKFVADSRTQVYFAQHVASTCNTVLIFVARQVGHKRGNTCNGVFQLVHRRTQAEPEEVFLYCNNYIDCTLTIPD